MEHVHFSANKILCLCGSIAINLFCIYSNNVIFKNGWIFAIPMMVKASLVIP